MSSEAGVGVSDLLRWTQVAPEAALAEVCAGLLQMLNARRAALLVPSHPDGLPTVVAAAGLDRADTAAWLATPPAPLWIPLRCYGRITGYLAIEADGPPADHAGETLKAMAALMLAAHNPHAGLGNPLEPLGEREDAAVPPLLVNPERFELARDLPRDSVLLAAAETRAHYRAPGQGPQVNRRASQGLFDALLDLVPGLALALEGPELRVVGASPLLAGQLGHAIRPGMRAQELLPDLPPDLVEALREAACTGEIPERLERMAARTLASEAGGHWSVGFRPFHWPDGQTRGVLIFGVGSTPGGTPGGTAPDADLLEICPTPLMMIALPDLRVVRHNTAMATLLEGAGARGASTQDLTIGDLVAPSTWTQAGPALRQLLATGEPVHLAALRAAFAGAESDERYFNWTLGLVRGPDGRPTHLLASALETTVEVRQRRHLEAAVFKAETLASDLRRVLDMLPEPMALYRRSDEPEWGNAAFLRLQGEMATACQEVLPRALDGITAFCQTGLGRVQATPLLGEGPPGALLTVDGGTLPETAGAAIRRTAALEAVLSSLTEGVLICDASGDTLLVNPTFCRLFGITSLPRARNERLGVLHLRDLSGAPLPLERTPVGLALSGHPASALRCLARRADGQDRVVESGAAVIHDADGRVAGCAIVVRDVTQHQRLTEERDDFISVASHELRTPLTALWLEVQLLSRTAQRTGVPEGWMAHLRRLYASADRMKRLVDGLLDVSRLERGAATIHPESLDLGAVIQEEVQRLGDLYPSHPITFQRKAAPQVRADRMRIQQVLANLVDNAVKYCPPGTPIEVDLTMEAGTGVMRVRDRGPGLPDSDMSALFTRYFRGARSGSRRHPGLGLGLFISRQIAELHGGAMSAANHGDGGLEITLRLPLAVARD